MNNNKLKVVWLCHFSDEEVRRKYPQKTSRPLYNFARKILGLYKKNGLSSDFAPWVTGGIEEMRKHGDVELHIISPQTDMKGITCEFSIDGVYYHFYNPNWTLLLMHVLKNNALWRKLQNSSHHANKFISKIHPDIINMIGAENPYHSCTVLDVDKNIPVMVSLQTIYANPDRLQYKNNKRIDKTPHWYIDKLIQTNFHFFGVMGIMHRDKLLINNPNAVPLAFSFCGPKMPVVKEVNKEYDFINFAATHKITKGSMDSLKALAIVKEQYPDVNLNFVGGCTDEVRKELDAIIEQENLEDNVVFTPFFKEQKDLYQHIKKSRYALLPVYFDNVSGTTMQAMYYELPVITNITSGTPYINKDKKCVLLAEVGNVPQLASLMLELLNNPQKVEMLKNNAKSFADKYFDNGPRTNRLIADYKAIIANKKSGVPIPKELLFDENNPLV